VREALAVLQRRHLPGGQILGDAFEQTEAIRSATDAQAIQAFNGSHLTLKDAIKRATELRQALTDTALVDLDRARETISGEWPFLETEPDLAEEDREAAAQLSDLLQREDFFRVLPDIDQRTKRLESAFSHRRSAAVQARGHAYSDALETLRSTPGWEGLTEDQQARFSKTLASRADEGSAGSDTIPLLREQTANCERELKEATMTVLRAIEGDRVERVSLASYFQGGLDTTEQLDAALKGIREEIEALIAAGKTVLVD
jgi:hypothetical protein